MGPPVCPARLINQEVPALNECHVPWTFVICLFGIDKEYSKCIGGGLAIGLLCEFMEGNFEIK